MSTATNSLSLDPSKCCTWRLIKQQFQDYFKKSQSYVLCPPLLIISHKSVEPKQKQEPKGGQVAGTVACGVSLFGSLSRRQFIWKKSPLHSVTKAGAEVEACHWAKETAVPGPNAAESNRTPEVD